MLYIFRSDFKHSNQARSRSTSFQRLKILKEAMARKDFCVWLTCVFCGYRRRTTRQIFVCNSFSTLHLHKFLIIFIIPTAMGHNCIKDLYIRNANSVLKGNAQVCIFELIPFDHILIIYFYHIVAVCSDKIWRKQIRIYLHELRSRLTKTFHNCTNCRTSIRDIANISRLASSWINNSWSI